MWGKRLSLIAMAFCLALGTKPYIVMLAPGLALIGAYWMWKHRDARALPVDLQGQLPAIAFAGTIGIVLGGFWYGRNYLLFDNPFYPTDFELFGRLIFGTGSGGGQQGGFSLASLTGDLRMLVEQKIFDRQRYTPDLTNITGWGWFTFSCGLPTLVYGLATSASIRWLTAGFLLSFAVLFAGVNADPWNMRFTLWVPALFATCFALVVGRLQTASIRMALCGVATACMLLNFAGSLGTGFLNPSDWRRMARLPIQERSTAALGLFIGDQYQEALQMVPADEGIAYTTHGDGWVYPLYGADLSRKIRYLPLDSDEAITDTMHKHQLRYLFTGGAEARERNLVRAATEAGLLRKIGKALYVREQ